MYVCMYVCMYVFLYIYIYIYIYMCVCANFRGLRVEVAKLVALPARYFVACPNRDRTLREHGSCYAGLGFRV